MLFVLKTNHKIIFFIGIVFLISACAVYGDQNQVQDIHKKIQTQKKQVDTYSKKEIEIIKGLDDIDHTLNRTRKKALALSKEISRIKKEISQVNQNKDRLSRQMVLNEKYAAQRMVALYKMGLIGRLDVAGQPGSVFDFFVQQNSMKRIIDADFKVLESQNSSLDKFNALEQQLKKQILTKTSLETQFTDQIKTWNKESKKKESLLTDIRKKKKLSLAMVESLNQAAKKLDKKISSLKKQSMTSMGTAAFSRIQGQLDPPVRGKIISRFGPVRTGDYKSFTFQKGIDIKVKRGEPVKSVFKGKVMFTNWLKGYGNLLIIDHGDHYYTLYAHVDEVFKKKGERVKTGEVIATSGETGSIKGPCLHFEIRHHGKPLDPIKWLRKGA